MAETSTITVRLNAELKRQLEQLAESTQWSKSWLASEAIAAYVEQQVWQIEQIKEALEQAEQPETQWVEHGQVSDWLQSWGGETRLKVRLRAHSLVPNCGTGCRSSKDLHWRSRS